MPTNPNPNVKPSQPNPQTPVEAPQRSTPQKEEIDPQAKTFGKRH